MRQDGAPITVADALALPVLAAAEPEVVAGASGLDRPIRWVHAGEVANMADLLLGGELLLTTGMGFGTSAKRQRAFVQALAERGIAGLVVELGEALPSLPEALRVPAERAGLPLVALHRPAAYVAVTEAIHTELVNDELAVVRRGMALQRELVETMLEGDGIAAVLDRLAGELASTVVLEDAGGGILFHAGPGAAGAAAAGLTAPVAMGPGERFGRLYATDQRRAPQHADALVLEQGARLVAVALLRTRQEAELAVHERGNLLQALVAGEVTPRAFATAAAALRFAPRHDAVLPVAIDVGGDVGHPAWALAARDVDRDLRGRGLETLIGPATEPGQLLLVVGGVRDRAAAMAAVATVVREAAHRHGRLAALAVAAAEMTDAEGARAGLALAVEAAAHARGLPEQAWFDTTALDVDLLLRRVGDEALHGFADRALRPVLDHDAASRHPLLPTLQALCDHGGQRAAAARALNLNRQALYGRIARLEALLGVALDDQPALQRLALALAARRVA